jgi:N-acetylglucosaminyldiphosphoundecaprenol N-acetyl-beta-D-mannosaminyltransferase
MLETINILEYKINVGGKSDFGKEVKGVVNTINPHCYIVSLKDNIYRQALLYSDYLIPDGVGIQLAAMIINGKKISKIAGSDLHRVILQKLNNSAGRCFYLGSTENTLGKIKDKLSVEFPEIQVGIYSPPFREVFSDEDNLQMIKVVNDFKPDVLFVGMTAPKQEKWVYLNKSKLETPLICSIGAVFDFYAGTIKRPGKFWISLGLEWLPRLLREPKRLWRRNFISNPLFMLIVIKEKIRMLMQPLFVK